MTKEEAKKLSLGVYVIFWKSGGSSAASVGQLCDGTPWFAPSDWTHKTPEGIASTEWRLIGHVSRLYP